MRYKVAGFDGDAVGAQFAVEFLDGRAAGVGPERDRRRGVHRAQRGVGVVGTELRREAIHDPIRVRELGRKVFRLGPWRAGGRDCAQHRVDEAARALGGDLHRFADRSM